jgi:hypothetical protein
MPLGITTRDNMLAALQRNSQADTVSKPEQVTCNDTSYTVSGTYTCPDGGSIAVSGDFSASSTSTTGAITETNCSDGTLVINGNPEVTLKAAVPCGKKLWHYDHGEPNDRWRRQFLACSGGTISNRQLHM